MAAARGSTHRPPREIYPPRNAAQARVLDLGISGPELARTGLAPKQSGYLWLSGEGRPQGDQRARLFARWPELEPELWDYPPPGVEETAIEAQRRRTQQARQQTLQGKSPLSRGRVLPTRGPGNTGAPVLPTPATTIEDGSRHARQQRVMTASEQYAATELLLRALEAKTEDALDALSDYERVTAHAGFRAMRAQLLEILACDENLHGQMLAVLPEPDPAGTVAKLRAVREELESIWKERDADAQHLLACGAYSQANKIDGQNRRVRRLLERARMARVPLKEVLALRAWQAVSGAAANILRDNRDAVAVCAEELEVSSEAFSQELARVLRETSAIVWPCPRYQADILGFFREILGVEPYDKQAEMLLMVQDNPWTATRSGHRVGKSLNLNGIALWLYCSFERMRVFMTAPTERQLIEVDWRELRIRKAESGICVECRKANAAKPAHLRAPAPCPHSAKIDGVLAEKPKGGLKSEDFRQVTGFTAKDAEGTAGLAGGNIAFLVEEASGVNRSVFVAIKGNLAGGGRLALFGNPTRSEGEFFDAFHSLAKKEDGSGFYVTMTISSWDSPNVRAGRIVIPGLATTEWCEARKEEWGEDSALYKIRVIGEHATEEDGRLFSVQLVTEAEARWELEEHDGGPLYIGIDPAGPSGLGDDSGFAPRRGDKILEVYAKKKLDEDGHLSEALGLIAKYGNKGEIATINLDSEGVGAGIVSRFQQYAASNPGVLRVFGIRSSSAAYVEPHIYHTERDELSANFARWCRRGGAIPTDIKLAAEMHAHELKMKLTPRGELMKVTPKDAIIRELHRSPDRYDACALSCVEQGVDQEAAHAAPEPAGGRGPGGTLDPHAAGSIDPYG